MRLRLFIVLVAGLLVLPGVGQANMVTASNYITASGPGTVGYTYLSLDADSLTEIQTFTDFFDPYMYLFYDDGSLDTGDYIDEDDDSGTSSGYGYSNSWLDLFLNNGHYVVAVGDYYMSEDEAISGINDPSSLGVGSGPYDLQINARTADVTVRGGPIPEPTSMLLLGISLIGLAGGRIRKKFRA